VEEARTSGVYVIVEVGTGVRVGVTVDVRVIVAVNVIVGGTVFVTVGERLGVSDSSNVSVGRGVWVAAGTETPLVGGAALVNEGISRTAAVGGGAGDNILVTRGLPKIADVAAITPNRKETPNHCQPFTILARRVR